MVLGDGEHECTTRCVGDPGADGAGGVGRRLRACRHNV